MARRRLRQSYAGAGEEGERSALKRQLLAQCVGINRGFSAREEERAQVMDTVRALEAQQPWDAPICNGSPEGKAPVGGTWRLAFTTALDVLSIGSNPFVEIGQIYQNIDPDCRAVMNIIEIQPRPLAALNGVVGSSMARLRVSAEALADGNERIRISFAKIGVEGVSFFGNSLEGLLPDFARAFTFGLPLRLDGGDPSISAGFFDTTFLDEDLRISVGSNGAIFVLVRE